MARLSDAELEAAERAAAAAGDSHADPNDRATSAAALGALLTNAAVRPPTSQGD